MDKTQKLKLFLTTQYCHGRLCGKRPSVESAIAFKLGTL